MLAWFQPLAKPKVSQLDFPIRKENVLRLYVAMHDVKSIQHFEGLQKLPENSQSLGLSKVALFFNSVVDCASVTIFIHEVVVVSRLKMILVLNDVFRRSDCGQSFYLVDSALLKKIILLKFLDWYDLDCKFTHFLGVEGPIYFAVSSFSNFLD
jgi:hypothetical protein